MTPSPAWTIIDTEHDGQRVKVAERTAKGADMPRWYIKVPPRDRNHGADVGPFWDRELALDIAACHFSHGPATGKEVSTHAPTGPA